MNIFVVTTPYHLLTACGLSKQGDFLLFEDEDFTHEDFAKKLAAKYFDKNTAVITSYKTLIHSPFSARRILRKTKAVLPREDVENLLYFNDSEPMVQFLISFYGKKSHCVLLDEGIGLYNDVHHKKKLLKKLFGKLTMGRWYKCINRLGDYPKTEIIVCKNPSMLGGKSAEKYIFPYSYDMTDALIKSEKLNYDADCWFVGQPLSEDGICTEKAYMDCVEKCAEVIANYGLKLTLKPHPREDLQKYKVLNTDGKINICEMKNIPFEVLVSGTEKTYIFTVSSSSILNLTAFPNIRLFSLYPMVKTSVSYENCFSRNEYVKTIYKWSDVENALESEEND